MLSRVFHSQRFNLDYILTNNLHYIPKTDDDLRSDTISRNKTLSSYLNNGGELRHAQKLFDEMPNRDIVSWNTMLSGLRKTNDPHRLFRCFLRMTRHGFRPNEVTISIALKAASGSGFTAVVLQLHAAAIRLSLHSDLFVGSALVRGYGEAGDPVGLRNAFHEILNKDVSSWNALVSGYMRTGLVLEARRVFEAMPVRDSASWASLITGYVGNRMINRARNFFDRAQEKSVVSWTAMIDGYVQNRSFGNAIELFVSMLGSGVRPNRFTFSTVLAACSGRCSLLLGRQVHSAILKLGAPADVVMLSSLVDMYAKCGDISGATRVFEAMPEKNRVSWNLIIGAYSRHGLAERALHEFDRMTGKGVRPDRVTFVSVLSACVHGGLVEEGLSRFKSMEEKYGIEPGPEHYACAVDLYGRAGKLEEAVELVKGMPVEPDIVVWGALVAASGLHSSLEVGKFAAEGMNRLEIKHPAGYSMLSKIHGELGCWSDVIGLRKMMKKKHVRKQNACSWVE